MPRDLFTEWVGSLEARHLADLRVPEVTRALRALSSAYVGRRHKMTGRTALDGAGKRAGFALFYGPLHYLTIHHVIRALGLSKSPTSILDLGCGTGAAGAAYATAGNEPPPAVIGIDRIPWAVDEARWTYHQFGLTGSARLSDLARVPPISKTSAVVAGYALNELSDAIRRKVEDALIAAGKTGAQILVAEPIARGVAPWWDDAAARIVEAGGRADEWRFPVELPPLLRLFDRATGLRHHVLTARTLSMNIDSR
jgi:SAM-dependent methyltransferase